MRSTYPIPLNLLPSACLSAIKFPSQLISFNLQIRVF